jgi:hypothetical protein
MTGLVKQQLALLYTYPHIFLSSRRVMIAVHLSTRGIAQTATNVRHWMHRHRTAVLWEYYKVLR